jgi:hypothetical protein
MRKLLIGGVILALALLAFLTFALFLALLFRPTVDLGVILATPTAPPTFTPTPTLTPVSLPPPAPAENPTATPTSPPAIPTPAATATATDTPAPTPSPTPLTPQLVAQAVVNVRLGPGTNYPVVGELPPQTPVQVTGQNQDGTWWQIELADGSPGWVAGSVVEAQNITGIPVAQAPPPPPPPPTPTPSEPTPPPRPAYQYEPTGWFGSKNHGLTRFLGSISDANGNPVNGVFVEAQCGTYHVISDPSGKPGWPAGFYDITLDTRPITCKWVLTVVEAADRQTVTARLSEAVEVETTYDQSIITANWRKNW